MGSNPTPRGSNGGSRKRNKNKICKEISEAEFFKTEMTLQISQVTKKGKEKENDNRLLAELERKIDSLRVFIKTIF